MTEQDRREKIAQLLAQAEPVSPPPDLPAVSDVNARLAETPLTDLGNAERFVVRCGADFRHCPSLGWLAWDGRRWKTAGADAEVAMASTEVVRAIQHEAAAIRGTNADKVVDVRKGAPVYLSDRISAWGRASENVARLEALRRVAAPMLSVDPAALDADPYLINVENGTLEVRRRPEGEYVALRPHNRGNLITKLMPVHYNPGATAPTFLRFIGDVQPVGAVRAFIQRWLGLSLIGEARDQKIAFFWGKGKNGKSTLIDVVGFIAGDYGASIPIETFLNDGRARGAGQASPDLAILPGVRFLRTSEPERGARLQESLVKLATGGEPIMARHLNRDYFRFYPQFKLTMSGNYRPEVRGNDEGIWRRLLLVPWTVTIADERRDPALPDKLRAEASGILNWLLDGLCAYLDSGLMAPEDVLAATTDYREESDPLGRFLKACTTPAPGGKVASAELYQLFVAWARAEGERVWSQRGFGLAMRETGIRRATAELRYWLDIACIRSPGDFAPAGASAYPGEGEEDA